MNPSTTCLAINSTPPNCDSVWGSNRSGRERTIPRRPVEEGTFRPSKPTASPEKGNGVPTASTFSDEHPIGSGEIAGFSSPGPAFSGWHASCLNVG